MIGGEKPPHLDVIADAGEIGSAEAVSLGLIVTELVINALKYAFPTAKADAKVVVTYESQGPDWQLSIVDNGVGKSADSGPPKHGGLGTVIIDALVKQLHAQMEVMTVPAGVGVRITRTSSDLILPQAA